MCPLPNWMEKRFLGTLIFFFHFPSIISFEASILQEHHFLRLPLSLPSQERSREVASKEINHLRPSSPLCRITVSQSFSIISELPKCSRTGKKACPFPDTYKPKYIPPFRDRHMAFTPGTVVQLRSRRLKGDSYLKVTLIWPVPQTIHLWVATIVARWHNIYYCHVLVSLDW